jgi:hypothetical protein
VVLSRFTYQLSSNIHLRLMAHHFFLNLFYSPVIGFILSYMAASFDLLLDMVESQIS